MVTPHPDTLGDNDFGPVTVSVPGPLVVTVGGREVSAGSRRQRALLQRFVIGGSDMVPVRDRPFAVVATYRPSEVTATLLPALACTRLRAGGVGGGVDVGGP